ncbi:MAG: hypothetical protein K0Q79_3718 [Flavipsychrobacter sp.]|jgi:hypothetical protein|nr:hypothetical protein [Flavipsychrobacter sp.]
MTLRLDKKDKIFISVITLVHAVFFLLAYCYKRIYMGDSFEYIYEALNIKQHLFFYSGNPALPIEPEYMTQRQPLYPLFLLGIYLFSINNWIVLILQNLLSIFNILYLRKTLFKIGYQPKYDWLLLLFTIAYPAQFINANTIAPDILLQTFTLLYFGNFILLFQTKQLKHVIFMSLALIAGMFVKPILYPFVLVHIIILIAIGIYHKVLLQRTVLVAIMPLTAVLLYNYWNNTRTDKFHFTSNQAFNASYYYYPFISQTQGADSANKFLQKERTEYASIPEYKDRYDHANARGTELLKQNFAPYMLFHLKHSARIFIEPGKAEIDLFTGKLTYGKLYSKEQTGFFATWKNKGIAGIGEYLSNNPSMLAVIIILIFNCIRLLGLFRFFTNRNIHWLLRLFIFVLVSYFAIAAGPIANTRYFLPVSLIVIGCTVLGVMKKLNKETA